MKTPQLKTERLYLRSVKKDVDEIFEGWIKDERISRYMLWNDSDDREDDRHFVEEEIKQINSDSWYRWIIILQETGQIIGTCLLYNNVTEKSWDISYNLSYGFFKHGYMEEAMKEVMRFAFQQLGIQSCIAKCAQENRPSRKLIERLGFQFVKEVDYSYEHQEITTGYYYCLEMKKG